jgi:hypothetical protein
MSNDRKFCTSCQATKPLEGGVMVGTKVRRWKCGGCVAKQTTSPYARVSKEAQYDHRH